MFATAAAYLLGNQVILIYFRAQTNRRTPRGQGWWRDSLWWLHRGNSTKSWRRSLQVSKGEICSNFGEGTLRIRTGEKSQQILRRNLSKFRVISTNSEEDSVMSILGRNVTRFWEDFSKFNKSPQVQKINLYKFQEESLQILDWNLSKFRAIISTNSGEKSHQIMTRLFFQISTIKSLQNPYQKLSGFWARVSLEFEKETLFGYQEGISPDFGKEAFRFLDSNQLKNNRFRDTNIFRCRSKNLSKISGKNSDYVPGGHLSKLLKKPSRFIRWFSPEVWQQTVQIFWK